ncbi:probable rRNA maturation factor [Desulfocicer vacuolatum DSM 3385]|uniref:Endoribonuclease YbeY n=1 Tax=Desulfocicer vacuolatum DSM 3385 TaxID=1121400 RepID=A0A1W1YKS9_9BACT|nr:probable rRNA maturation factor [Desulfocicer vacuolatum DSM 3385]
MAYEDHELSIVITDNEEIKKMNRIYRNMDRPTNVLAFPMLDPEDIPSAPGTAAGENHAPPLLGDIVISMETAAKEAETASISLDERISQLMVHGILHLVGYDHEQGEDKARHMEEKSLELIRLIEPNPDLEIF